MKVYFYCSYNLSPAGYQKIALDPATGEQRLGGGEDKTISTLLTHGGARSAFGLDGADYYFVIKGMKSVDDTLPPETPGHSKYLNLGLSAREEELEALCAVAYAAYTNYRSFVRKLAGCITPREGELSYAVDAEGWRQLVKESGEKYRPFAESGITVFSDAPGGLPQPRLTEALALLREKNILALYEFVLLEGDAAYFRTSCGCDDLTQPVHFVLPEEDAPRQAAPPSRPAAAVSLPPELTAADILLGAAAIGTMVCCAYQLGKVVGKLRRRRKK